MNKDEIQDFITKWIELKSKQILDGADDLFIIGKLDSLSFIELIINVEEKFLISINFEELLDWESVRTPIGLSNFIFKSSHE